MKRPVVDWKLILNWRTYAKLSYIRKSYLLLYILYPDCNMNALPLSLVHCPHHHLCTSHPYVNLSQRDCGLAHTSSGVDAQVSVSSPPTLRESLLIWCLRIPFGWIIPIVVLIVLSFPPLFGHEIVGVLCGVVCGTHHVSRPF